MANKAKAYRMTFDNKAKEIVEKMTLEEKVDLMGGNVDLKELMSSIGDPQKHYNYIPYAAGGNDKYGVPPMKFCDGPRGVVSGVSTCFPVTMARGATFDLDLEYRIGKAIGKEVLANGGNLFAGVCINLPYNPGWGRSQEVYGEESFHLGRMGAALTEGVQSENVIACVKHYAFNSMEISRFKVSVDCGKRTEREVFLPHFKDCVDAGAGAVMSAYNKYQGTHCGHSDYLLNQVLNGEWGFDGFVMSDFIWGVRDTVEAANGGQCMEMCNTNFFGPRLVQAVKDGKVKEETVDIAARRIIRTLLAFEAAGQEKYGEDVLACKEHVALALEAAEKSITLLKNERNLLPLRRETAKRILVVGKLANVVNIGDYGSSRVYPPYVVTPLEGITKAAPAAGVSFCDGSDLEEARKLAASADAVVFIVGYNHDDEGEYVAADQSQGYTEAVGGDRAESLGLHEDEIELIKAVGPVNSNSVAVLIGGNTILIDDDWADSVSAILMAFYPGLEGGTALAEILFGDVNPSGKLPYVTPYKESDLPQVDWDTEEQFYGYYHGYAKLEKEGVAPRYPYGYGLSYTTFTVSNAEFAASGGVVRATCEVTNTGGVAGDEVVQMYVGFKNSAVDRPVKLLRGFQRVSLLPGETKKVTITCGADKLTWYNPATKEFELEHMPYEVYIGTSSDPKDLLEGSVCL